MSLEDEYVLLLKNLLPYGPAWEDDERITGFAPVLSRFHARTDDLMREINPAETVELIDRYEALCGLPDECAPPGVQTLAQRQRRLSAKVNGFGGLNESFYYRQLQALGYPDVTITQFQNLPDNKPDAWPEGATKDTYRFYWQVNIPQAANLNVMTCQSACNESLRTWGDTVIECVIDKLRPSHSIVIFSYL